MPVRIISVHNRPGGASTADKLQDEYLIIRNTGTKAMGIGGWKIKDAQGHEYVFPETLANGDDWKLEPHHYLFLVTGPGRDAFYHKTHTRPAQYQLYCNRGWFIWNIEGDMATMYDDKGRIVQKYLVPAGKLLEPIRVP